MKLAIDSTLNEYDAIMKDKNIPQEVKDNVEAMRKQFEKKDEQIPVFENSVPKLEENFEVSNSNLDVIETQKFDLENKTEEKNLDDKKDEINIEESNLNGENYFKSLEIKENKELVEDQINIPEAEMEENKLLKIVLILYDTRILYLLR